jgi:CheY-like chemotaxis protein
VRTARDGDDALAAIAIERPQLVLSDLLMPGMDGLEFIARLRQEHPAIPIIILSAAAKPVISLPDIPFLAKPFAWSALLAVVEAMLPLEDIRILQRPPDSSPA